MEEVIDHHGWLTMMGTLAEITSDILHTLLGAEVTHIGVEFAPVGQVATGVSVMIEAVQFKMVLEYPLQDTHLVVSPRKSMFSNQTMLQ